MTSYHSLTSGGEKPAVSNSEVLAETQEPLIIKGTFTLKNGTIDKYCDMPGLFMQICY